MKKKGEIIISIIYLFSRWALGIERILLMLDNVEISLNRSIAVIPVVEEHEINGKY